MVRPSAQNNLVLWELVSAFMLVTCAGIIHVFHFFNNDWLQQHDGDFTYLRGLGDDCLKMKSNPDNIVCSGWNEPVSVFVKHGQNISSGDVSSPTTGLMLSRVMLILTTFLYLIVVFLLFVVCVKQDLFIKKILCGFTLLLVFLDCFAAMPIFISSYSNIVANRGKCTLGKAFYFYLVSIMLLLLGSASHIHTWLDVYIFLKAERESITRTQNAAVRNPHEMRLMDDERRPTFLPA